jgi:hypothetical protein
MPKPGSDAAKRWIPWNKGLFWFPAANWLTDEHAVADVNVQIGAAGNQGHSVLCVRGFEPDGTNVRCSTDGQDLLVPRAAASFLRPGDLVRVWGADSPVCEYLATRQALRRNRRHLYFGQIGCATAPKLDPRNGHSVRVEVPTSRLGILILHVPSQAIREYFYNLGPDSQGEPNPNLYEVLRSRPAATPSDLRLAYRIVRLELEGDDSARSNIRRAERAFNLLAHPLLRSCYDALMRDPAAPALFPYGGFGQCVAAGELAADGHTFFVSRILSHAPSQRTREFRVPLRRLEYFAGYARYRDSRRKVEMYIDPSLLSLEWDPTWNQWKHLISAKVGVSGTFVQSGEYRRAKDQWELVKWEAALPSRLSLSVPAQTALSVGDARRIFERCGEYHDAIRHVQARLQQEALDQNELQKLCRRLGIPPDFDVAQFCWKPDYDRYFYERLKRASRNIYFLRDEFVFLLPRAIVIEVPQSGHATYVFMLPPDVAEFVRRYAMTTREDIRNNRGNVAQELGFVGRIMHGRSPRRWLQELQARAGGSLAQP